MEKASQNIQLNKTLPAYIWSGRVTIPAVEGVIYGDGDDAGSRIPYSAGDEIGQFRLTKTLCVRHHCRLFLGEDRSQRRVVIKIFEPGTAKTTKAVRILASSLQKQRCPSLMPLLSYGDLERGMHYQVMPVYQQGTLENEVMPEEDLLKIVIPQLNEALLFLKRYHLVHNDIKPANLFWKDRFKKEIVLGDYDCLTTDKDDTEAGGTLFFMAPERILSGGTIHTNHSDYCSMGLTLIALLLGKPHLENRDLPLNGDFENLRDGLLRLWQREEKVKCPETAASINTRILLNGLIMADMNTRSGYCGENIFKWLKTDLSEGGVNYKPESSGYNISGWLGYDLPSNTGKGGRKKEAQFIGLPFRNRLILNIPDLIDALGQDWDYGIFMLKEHQLDRFVRQFDIRFYTCCQEFSASRDLSAGLFKLMHTIAPTTDFYWLGVHYDSLEDFTGRTEKEGKYGIKDPFSMFCRAGLLSFYLQQRGADSRQIQRAGEIEKIGAGMPEQALKKLQFSLQEKPDLVWEGTKLRSLEDLLAYLEDHKEQLDGEILKMYSSASFKIWLDYIQHGSLLSAVKRKMIESEI